ncbi:hypothetical protein F2P56_024617 [Juglans regia]|uniref:Uncharacterized protein n=2 Tax=Juglans regia TaxID=51240 RepID=A0A833U0G8_JUGRE|nr:uncharacterized protein LOC109017907 [Juglans regia]KAF5454997.1 hypothetical protein F2P56_024617 [Juglans regia]
MEDFRQAIESNNIYDMGWKESVFTWSNKYSDCTFTKERLHRVVANMKWADLFRERVVEAFLANQSDHKDILLDLIMTLERRRGFFRFKAKWILDEEDRPVVEEAWGRSGRNSDSLKRI